MGKRQGERIMKYKPETMKYKPGTKLVFLRQDEFTYKEYWTKGEIYTIDESYVDSYYAFLEFRGRGLHGGWSQSFIENENFFKLAKIENWKEIVE